MCSKIQRKVHHFLGKWIAGVGAKLMKMNSNEGSKTCKNGYELPEFPGEFFRTGSLKKKRGFLQFHVCTLADVQKNVSHFGKVETQFLLFLDDARIWRLHESV